MSAPSSAMGGLADGQVIGIDDVGGDASALADLIPVSARPGPDHHYPPPSQTGDEQTHHRAIAALLSGDTPLADLPTIAGLLVHALLALGTDLPAAVLAAQLGLSTTTPSGWAGLSQRD